MPPRTRARFNKEKPNKRYQNIIKMEIIDLTMPLDEKTPPYPGDTPLKLRQLETIQNDGCNKKSITCTTHCGTHIDVPAHMIVNGATLDELPLDRFMGDGVLIDVRKKEITVNCLKEQKIPEQSVVLFLTGQSEKLYQKYYAGVKYIPEDVALELVKKKVKAIGVDSPGPDAAPHLIHKLVLPHNIILIENLINVEKLVGKKFTVQYFPLRITGGDGSPCRALAFVE